MIPRCATVLSVVALLLVGFGGTAAAVQAADDEEVDVLIQFRGGAGNAERAAVREHRGTVRRSFRLVPAVAARVPRSELAALRRNPRIDRIEPDLEVHASDAEMDNVWGVGRIGGAFAHAGAHRGAGVRVAVIDTGIDYNHPDLNANYAGGWDFVNDDNDPWDDDGHGTHVAGTIAAEDDGYGAVGVAPDVRLYALKVLDANGSGSFSDVIAAVEWCIDEGIHITNNSYGSSGNPGSIVKSAFDRAAAAGILMVAAAGNSGTSSGTTDSVEYPARFSSVLAVAATTSSDARASFSSTGPDVEIAAPGQAIYSTIPDNRYASWSGTSMACPHVVGAAAVLFGAGVTDASDLRFLLSASAQDLGAAGLDTHFGNGLIDLVAALSAVSAPPAPDPDPGSDPTPSGLVGAYDVEYAQFGGKRNNKSIAIAVHVLDDGGLPVPDAVVSVRVTRGAATVLTADSVTDSSGIAVFTIDRARRGTYATEILDIQADSLTWDGLTPANSYTK